jgi:HPt (histidine-containing phosphotransfer) domain-containing protein
VLFYNHKHEFIGIDEEGLKLLNYATLEDLLGVCADVADLFAKEPGYIHNFKNFGWIDFLLHADSDARSAIVHANGRTFSCTLHVNNFFLCAEPGQNGYIIDMVHIQSISGDEIKPSTLKPSQYIKEVHESAPAPTKSSPLATDSLPNYKDIIATPLSEPGTLDVPTYNESDFETPTKHIEDIYTKLALPLSDEELHEEEVPTLPVEPHIERPMLGDVHYSKAEKEFINNLKVDKYYRFDPNVAAHELGLPVDLILEFIGDFIQQSYEFKDELFEAVLKGDSNNIKILSHKLKGVAANLRIEDAFEALSVINTSEDLIEIEANLKYFYTIISKLEGKEPAMVQEEAPIEAPVKTPEFTAPMINDSSSTDDDIYELSFKDDEPLAVQKELSAEENISEEIDLTPEVSIEEEPLVEIPIQSLHYDKDLIASQLGIENDFFDELIDEYKHDALKAGQEIMAAIGAFDTHSWKRTASQLKGISDNLRLSQISEELAILSQTNDAQEANKASKRLNGFLEQL